MATGKQVLSDEVRRTWRETLNEVEQQEVHVTVLRYNTPAAVIGPVSWYEAATTGARGDRMTALTRNMILPSGQMQPGGRLAYYRGHEPRFPRVRPDR